MVAETKVATHKTTTADWIEMSPPIERPMIANAPLVPMKRRNKDAYPTRRCTMMALYRMMETNWKTTRKPAGKTAAMDKHSYLIDSVPQPEPLPRNNTVEQG